MATPVNVNGPTAAARAPREELRVALVLNGGVSLAVWMGGVALEIDRLTRGDGAYGAVLDVLRAGARVDVITGTSAGGINGAALALAQASSTADVSVLRDVWAEHGRMESLLRAPFHGAPPSMLRGDEYFLPSLERAFARLSERWTPRPPDERPLELTITTTLLRGARTVTVDSLGQRIPQSTHEGRFTFRRGPDATDEGDFATDAIDATVARLALAARSTASFPVAFEPSYVPVGGPRAGEDAAAATGHVDMGANASWRSDGAGASATDRSRYVVDGGLLVNTPTRAALSAIDAMPAALGVRRVMLLVHPHAADVGADDPADDAGAPPTLAAATTGLLSAMSSQGSRSYVEDIAANNRVARSVRGGRHAVVANLAAPDATGVPAGDPVSALYRLAASLHAHFRSQRMRREGARIADLWPAVIDWPWERVAEHAVAEQQRIDDLPYVPTTWAWPSLDAVVGAPGPEAWNHEQGGWTWGLSTVEHCTDAATDVLRLLVGVLSSQPAAQVAALREQLHGLRARLRDLRARLDVAWFADPGADGPDAGYWVAIAERYRAVMGPGGELGGVVRDTALEVAGVMRAGCRILETADLRGAGDDERALLIGWCRMIGGEALAGEPAQPDHRVLCRLVALDVVTTCLADDPDHVGSPIDLVQVSLHTQNAFARQTRTPDDKVGGYSLGRFSGFLKQSWRINDWTWGRIDAATMLLRTVLSPERLRRVARIEGRFGAGIDPGDEARATVDALVVGAFAGAGELPPEIAACRERAIAELAAVYDPGVAALPRSLPELAALVAWAVHVDVVLSELPVLAEAISRDAADGAYRGSRGRVFLDTQSALVRRIQELDDAAEPAERLRLGLTALAAFDRAGIGREPLAEEGGSDQMVRTAATAVGVGITVLDGPGSGLGAVRPITRVVRGASLLPYWAVVGLTRGGGIARFLAQLALAAGGAIIALALLAGAPGWVTALGVGAVLTAFAYGALRTGSLLHGLVLLSPVVPLAIVAAVRGGRGDNAGRVTLISIALVVVGLLVLGSLPNPMGTPYAIGARVAERIRRLLVKRLRFARRRLGDDSPPSPLFVVATWLVLLAGACGAVIAIARLGPLLAGLYNDIEDSLSRDPSLQIASTLLIAGAVAVPVGTLIARSAGSGLRRWRELPGDGGEQRWQLAPATEPEAVTAGWSVVYGIAYGAAAIALAGSRSGRWPDWWLPLVLTAFAFAFVLLLVIPWSAPWTARHRIGKALLAAPLAVGVGADDTAALERDLLALMETLDQRYAYLVDCGHAEPVLTKAGVRLRERRAARISEAAQAAGAAEAAAAAALAETAAPAEAATAVAVADDAPPAPAAAAQANRSAAPAGLDMAPSEERGSAGATPSGRG